MIDLKTLRTFEHSPELKRLLTNYVLQMYEADADTSDRSLLTELQSLLDDNNLQAIFVTEYQAHNC